MEYTLIANTGLQFKKTYIKNVDPKAKIWVANTNGRGGRNLEYNFQERRTPQQHDDGTCSWGVTFRPCIESDLRDNNGNTKYIPYTDSKLNNLNPKVNILMTDNRGKWILDEVTGTPLLNPNAPQAIPGVTFPTSNEVYKIDKLAGKYRCNYFEKLLGQWLPMPMYEKNDKSSSCTYPNGWCRVRIDVEKVTEREDENGEKKKIYDYRLTWAFDTKLADYTSNIRPFFEDETKPKKFGLCNQPDLLIKDTFISPNGNIDTYLKDILGDILRGSVPQNGCSKDFEYLGFYIYLINYLRVTEDAVPQVTLFCAADPNTEIPVDMSMDIGNSRTCVTLYVDTKEGKEKLFRNAAMLGIRDLTEPWKEPYNNIFDTRFAFRKADFGSGLCFCENGKKTNEDLFLWPSLVRVGEEASRLIYKGASEKNTDDVYTRYYSSPKRYLWDTAPFNGKWQNIVLKGEKDTAEKRKVEIKGVTTKYFDESGKFNANGSFTDKEGNPKSGGYSGACHYSRSSLMTFVMMEIFQQAFCFINSEEFRNKVGKNPNARRCLRNVIVTCPTAMPVEEQKILRKAADAAKCIITNLYYPMRDSEEVTEDGKVKKIQDTSKVKTEISIVPSLKMYNDRVKDEDKDWQYDEALANQFVYLYAEIQEKYKGHAKEWFDLKGHIRDGETHKSLTIGSVDIGAGTTDVMVSTYRLKGESTLVPTPIYYDTFYKAGDDIVYRLIKEVVIEDLGDNEYANKLSDEYGSIWHAFKRKIKTMQEDDLYKLIPISGSVNWKIGESNELKDNVAAIKKIKEKDAKSEELDAEYEKLAKGILKRFFGEDVTRHYDMERLYRHKFCTQVSIPLVQKFLELRKENIVASDYSFDEIFNEENKPDEDLLTYFKEYFGFSFAELKWHYDPKVIDKKIRNEMKEDLIEKISWILYTQECDIVVLSGRPTGLTALSDIMMECPPVTPDRLVKLEDYNVGAWYPLAAANESGYFGNRQKALVSVGAEIGHLAKDGFNDLRLEFENLKNLKSTVNYVGFFKDGRIDTSGLTPNDDEYTKEDVHGDKIVIGCKKFNLPKYNARPLYVIENKSKKRLNVTLRRKDYEDNPEKIDVEIEDSETGRKLNQSEAKCRLKTLSGDDFWMDNGAFYLT